MVVVVVAPVEEGNAALVGSFVEESVVAVPLLQLISCVEGVADSSLIPSAALLFSLNALVVPVLRNNSF